MRVPFSRVDCSGNEAAYIQEVLDSGWLTTASKAAELETRIAELTGAKHACAVNSCTAALHLALEALGIAAGDQVFVPTWTFTASAEVIRYLGADPIFLDVDYGTGALTADLVDEALRRYPKVKAIVVVHYGGQAAPMLGNAGIRDVCLRHGVRIVEDAAHAFPAREGGKMVGNIGDVTCFSFYANKTITTGEGGMLVTNDDSIANRVRLMRLHGIDRDVWDRFTSNAKSWEYDVRAPGFKYNMPDVNAAIGLAQIERIEEMRAARQCCAERYFDGFSDLEILDLPQIRVPFEHHAWHLFPVVLKKHACLSRDEMIEKLMQDGIGTSVHYKPLHRMSYYRERYGLKYENFPAAERLWKGTISLPIYSSLREDEQAYVIERVRYHLTSRADCKQ